MNILKNPSLENGAVSWGGYDNIWLPVDYDFSFDDTTFNKWDVNNSPFSQPEAKVINKHTSLPPDEWDELVWDFDHTWQCFGSYRAIWVTFWQVVALEIARYRFVVHINADLYDAKDANGNKIPADDPTSGMIQFFFGSSQSAFTTMQPYLEMNTYTWNFDATASGPQRVGVSIRLPHPLKSNGFFLDGVSLEITTPKREYDRVIHLLPQDTKTEELDQVVREAYPKRQSITFSADDAVITHPNLKSRTVHAWDIQRIAGSAEEFEEWVEEYYPPYPTVIERNFDKPPPPPPPPPPSGPYTLLTFQRQNPPTGWLDYLLYLANIGKPVKWVKLIDTDIEQTAAIKSVSPKTRVCFRRYRQHQGEFWDLPPYDGANRWCDTFWDSVIANGVDAVESLNEMIATNDIAGINRTVAFDAAFAEVVSERSGGTIAPVTLLAGVGNPQHGAETELLLPAARATALAGGYIGGHTYFPAHPVHSERWMEEYRYDFHMRPLLSWDPIFVSHGVYCRYMLTEMGACAAADIGGVPGGMNFLAGWKHSDALGGDVDRYIRLLMRNQEMVVEWNAQHNERCEALVLFVGGGTSEWVNFEIAEILPQLAAAQ